MKKSTSLRGGSKVRTPLWNNALLASCHALSARRSMFAAPLWPPILPAQKPASLRSLLKPPAKLQLKHLWARCLLRRRLFRFLAAACPPRRWSKWVSWWLRCAICKPKSKKIVAMWAVILPMKRAKSIMARLSRKAFMVR